MRGDRLCGDSGGKEGAVVQEDPGPTPLLGPSAVAPAAPALVLPRFHFFCQSQCIYLHLPALIRVLGVGGDEIRLYTALRLSLRAGASHHSGSRAGS